MAATVKRKQRTEEVFKIQQLAKSFIDDAINANNILDVHAGLESDDASVVAASIAAIEDIFTHLLERKSMHMRRPPTDHEHMLDRSAEEKYKIWLRERYEGATTRLLDFVVSSKQKVQDSLLSALMKFVSLEGKRPLQDIAAEKIYFPVHLLEIIVRTILSDVLDTKTVIDKFEKTYLCYPDVKFNTLKIMKNMTKTSKSDEHGAVYLMNFFSLMKKLTFDADSDEDLLGENLCEHEGASSAFKFKPKIAKKIFGLMWLNFLKPKNKLPGPLHRRVLLSLDDGIMSCMESPLLLTDYLFDSYKHGGIYSLLALGGLFHLMRDHNLEFPDFYKNLYSLMKPDVFYCKYRARFFFLADEFLTSTHLPETMVAAFAKRLSRMALQAPTDCLELVIYFVQNLLFRHQGLFIMIHNPKNSKDRSIDPFLNDEPNPENCRAMESSLWEIKTLQSHYHPKVSSAAKFVDRPLPKEEVDIRKYLDLTYTEMFKEEMKRELKKDVPMANVRPTGLFSKGGSFTL